MYPSKGSQENHPAKGRDKRAVRIPAADEEAFNALVDDYEETVRSYLFRLLGNREDAEDQAQETFLRVYRNLGRFRGEASVKTWILKIASRLAIDERRRNQRKPAPLPLAPETTAGLKSRPSEDPAAAAVREEKQRTLTAAIQELPFLQRAALVLKITEGLTYADIAETLNTTKDSAKTSVHLARQKLRRRN